MAELRDWLDLVRIRATPTVVGDTLAGAVAAGGPLAARTIGLPLASALLYSAGMALNDYADAELDAVERPERPIPSGRIRRGSALALAGALTVGGLAVAGLAGGRRSLVFAVPLAAGIWSYDLVAKTGPLGPVVMAGCRGLDVLMGAGSGSGTDSGSGSLAGTGVGSGSLRAALPVAAAVTGHTLAVTVLSRGEVHGTEASVAAGAAAASAAVAVGVLLQHPRNVEPSRRSAPGAHSGGRPSGVDLLGRALAVVGVARYLGLALGGQLAAVRSPDAGSVRTATRSGIRAMIPLQAAAASRHRPAVGAALLALDALTTLAAGRRSAPVAAGHDLAAGAPKSNLVSTGDLT